MRLSKKLVVVAVSAAAVLGLAASSAAADTGVDVTNPGTVSLHSSSVVIKSSGVTVMDCDVVMMADVDTGGTLSNFSFVITPGTANCAAITATSTGGYICNDGGTNYWSMQLTTFLGGSPISSGTIRGDINATGDEMTWANSPVVGLGAMSLDATFDIDPPLEIDQTEDPCPA